MDKKVSAFFVGNLVGLTILVGGVVLTLPQKLKETEALEKQKLVRKSEALAQANKSKTEVNKTQAFAPYVVASRNISRGETIGAAEVTLEKLPPDQGHDSLSALSSVIGKTTTADIKKGSLFTDKVLR